MLVIASMFSAVRPLRRDPRWHRLAYPTLAWAVATVPLFIAVPAVGDAYFGLAQRMLLTAMLSWILTVALFGRRVLADRAGRKRRHRTVTSGSSDGEPAASTV